MVKLRIEKHITSRSSVMNEIDLKIHDTLEYIKVNPNCNTNPDCLDGHLVEDLHNKEFIKGIKVTHQQSTSPEYISLHITTDGEKHLNELKEKTNILQIPHDIKHASNNTSHYWYQKPIGIICITAFSGVLIAMILYLINKHFGIPL